MGYPAVSFVAIYVGLSVAGIALGSAMLYAVAAFLGPDRQATVRIFFLGALLANVVGAAALLTQTDPQSALQLVGALVAAQAALVVVPYGIARVAVGYVPGSSVLRAVPFAIAAALGVTLLTSAVTALPLAVRVALGGVVALFGPALVAWGSWAVWRVAD